MPPLVPVDEADQSPRCVRRVTHRPPAAGAGWRQHVGQEADDLAVELGERPFGGTGDGADQEAAVAQGPGDAGVGAENRSQATAQPVAADRRPDDPPDGERHPRRDQLRVVDKSYTTASRSWHGGHGDSSANSRRRWMRPIKPTVVCGPWHAVPSAWRDRRGCSSGRGSRACGPDDDCSVGRCASRGSSAVASPVSGGVIAAAGRLGPRRAHPPHRAALPAEATGAPLDGFRRSHYRLWPATSPPGDPSSGLLNGSRAFVPQRA